MLLLLLLVVVVLVVVVAVVVVVVVAAASSVTFIFSENHSIENLAYLMQDSQINRLLKYTVTTIVTQLFYWRGYLIVTNS
jgi:hypothetical protein